jgi:SAM-dependent methyltransferase
VNHRLKAFYNASGVHPTTDPSDNRSQFAVAPFLDIFSALIRPGMRALDLGCNAGRFTFAMASQGAMATGIDYALVPLRHARKVAAESKSECTFNLGDIAHLPYGSNAFDLVLIPNNIVEHSYDTFDSLCRQLVDILKDDGLFVVTMHDELVKRIGQDSYTDNYDVFTGVSGGQSTIPGKGTFDNPGHFWTVAFAKYVIGQYFSLIDEEHVADNRWLLVFRNNLLERSVANFVATI